MRNVFSAGLLFILTFAAAAPAQGPTTSPATSVADEAEAAIVNPKRSHFDASIPSEVKTRTTISGHMLVPAKVNGKDVGWFILDTGAGMSCIDKSVADEIKLADGGDITANGMGGSRASKLRKYDTLSVGPVVVEQGVLLELNLKPYGLLMGGIPIAGIIGHECFGAGVFDMDLYGGTVHVFDPRSYVLDPAAGAWQAMQIISRRPAISGTIEGSAPGMFVLDTGSNEAVLIHAPTVKNLKLLDGRKTSVSVAGGVGGMKKVRHGKLDRVMLAGCDLRDVSATFSEAGEGLTSSSEAMGTVGLGLLNKFRLIVDQSAGKIALQRVEKENQPAATRPITSARSPSTEPARAPSPEK